MSYNATERHTRIMHDFLAKAAEDTPGEACSVDGELKVYKDDVSSEDAPDKPLQLSNAVLSAVADSREEMLSRLFNEAGTAVAEGKKDVKDVLSDTPESSAPVLGQKVSADMTVRERTKNLL